LEESKLGDGQTRVARLSGLSGHVPTNTPNGRGEPYENDRAVYRHMAPVWPYSVLTVSPVRFFP
jgi:hypothetical protein